MDKIEFREKFSQFLADDERYRKFICQLNLYNQNRFKFWQEKVLKFFAKENSIPMPTYTETQKRNAGHPKIFKLSFEES